MNTALGSVCAPVLLTDSHLLSCAPSGSHLYLVCYLMHSVGFGCQEMVQIAPMYLCDSACEGFAAKCLLLVAHFFPRDLATPCLAVWVQRACKLAMRTLDKSMCSYC